MKQTIEQQISSRLENRMEKLFSSIALCLSYEHDSYYVAGNSCNAATPNDFDLYPACGSFNFKDIERRLPSVGGYAVCKTRNAMTCNIGGKVVQFCNYTKKDLESLVFSFDFAHIQIGAKVKIEWRPGDFEDDPGGYDRSYVDKVFYTDDWLNAHALETTWYTGSEYPLSSMMRLQKYAQRGCYGSKHECKVDVLRILAGIISRGYQDYQDYKDQLSAIDMMLLTEEERDAAKRLYETCCNRNLVKDTSSPWDNEEEDCE